ncbi:hypothetical protein CJ030_MR5G003566 [Morella rubra]|uniref:Uncharacterized protein n=1 Tax=Morella rubra TaxID=262757 RepID=A0A6A1VKU7_9ROSI|nr:hypothetical protein CJ030_MR5G003566 [Morella rubra]
MKFSGHWKIVQKITSRNTYDIPPIEEKASKNGEGPSNREAYQENESIKLFVDFSSFDMIPLTRNDIEAYVPVTNESGPQQREVEGSDDSSESFCEDLSFQFTLRFYFIFILSNIIHCAFFSLILIYLVTGRRHASGRETSSVRFISSS